jgi:hypothetical protein
MDLAKKDPDLQSLKSPSVKRKVRFRKQKESGIIFGGSQLPFSKLKTSKPQEPLDEKDS